MAVVENKNASGMKGIFIIVIVVVIAVGAYIMLTAPDRRTTGERAGDAVEDISRGNIGDAANSLKDQTPAEKVGNAVKDAGNDVRDAGN